MGLFDKVRILVGALVHKPFMPRPERVNLEKDEGPEIPVARRNLEPVAEEEGLEDTERVAVLIAQKRQDEADSGIPAKER